MTTEELATNVFAHIRPMSEEEAERRRETISSRERESSVNTLILQAGIPKRHNSTVARFEGEWGSTYQKLHQKLSTGFLCALVGTRGNGKTQIGSELIKANSQKLRTSRFCNAIEFFMDIKATYKGDTKSEKDVIKEYMKPQLLVIDEIGQRSDSEWENRLLFYLVNERYEACKDTLFIGNLEPIKLIEALGPSIASRMNEIGGVFECKWESFR